MCVEEDPFMTKTSEWETFEALTCPCSIHEISLAYKLAITYQVNEQVHHAWARSPFLKGYYYLRRLVTVSHPLRALGWLHWPTVNDTPVSFTGRDFRSGCCKTSGMNCMYAKYRGVEER
jgi:hypothetical protein